MADRGHRSLHSSILEPLILVRVTVPTWRAQQPAALFPSDSLFLGGSLSAPRADGICNPSDMFWVCPGFPPSLSYPDHFQREAPRHLSWLLRGANGLITQGSQITERLTLKCKVRPATLQRNLISSACVYNLRGEGPGQLQFKNTPVIGPEITDRVSHRIGTQCQIPESVWEKDLQVNDWRSVKPWSLVWHTTN